MLPDLETLDEDLLEDDTEDELDDFSDLSDDEDDDQDDLEELDDEEVDEEAEDVEEYVAARSEFEDFADELFRTLGHDVTPGHDELRHYWVAGPGLAKWAFSPKPWTTLVALLARHVGLRKAKIYASRWFIEHFGFAAGSDLNRVTHGKPPRGHRVGPG